MLRRGNFESGSISIITLLEVLRGISRDKRREVKELLTHIFNVLEIDNDVVEKYCELYTELKSRGRLLSDPDLIIAATAIVNKEVLKTRNKDFQILRDYGLEVEIL